MADLDAAILNGYRSGAIRVVESTPAAWQVILACSNWQTSCVFFDAPSAEACYVAWLANPQKLRAC